MHHTKLLQNPFRPGAGHLPPIMAGRHDEMRNFKRLLVQAEVSDNVLITGLRGFGKTVLLAQMQHIATQADWLWVGNDLSESSSLSEERLALRILTDIASAISARRSAHLAALNQKLGADAKEVADLDALTFTALKELYEQSPGLPSDRLLRVIQRVTTLIHRLGLAGLALAYDEAQCLSDHAERDEFPMSMLIEVVAGLQRSGICRCVLILSGLPQVFDALTATRTYTERMFRVMTLDRVTWDEAHHAICQPLAPLMPPLHITEDLINKIVDLTGGYPYLIQFFGRELVDQLLENGGVLSAMQFPSPTTLDRLDSGLFAARWNKTTDRQRALLELIASRPQPQNKEFSANDIMRAHPDNQTFDTASANNALQSLLDRGMIYRTRHGHYSFTVPMSEQMILRRLRRETEVAASWSNAEDPPPNRDTRSDASAAPSEQKRKRSWFRFNS